MKLTKEQVMGIIRHGLTFVGGILIMKGVIDEATSQEIIGSAIEVHKIMGRGLLENVYHQCLKEEFIHRKINFLS